MSTTSPRTIVIVGGGLAAAEAAKTLRGDGFDGRLMIVADEPRLPYERPPLSKAYLRGEVGAETLLAQDASWYEHERVEVVTGHRATGLDAAARSLTLDDGRRVAFDGLILATGARAIRPALAGLDRAWVHLLRTTDDADRLRADAGSAASAVVAGGGWIAAEVAASLRQLGLAVTLAVPADEVLAKHLGPEVGAILGALHEGHGVRVARGAWVEELVDGREGRGVRLANGEIVTGDLVVLGFGATPEVDLAVGAGLAVDRGITVDERLRTGVDGIYAAGDVASAWHPRYGQRIRSEHWDNARRQARTAARNLLGRDEPFDRVPYFYSDQFELSLEAFGRTGGDGDTVVTRRPVGDDGLVALWLRDGTVIGGLHANARQARKALDRLVASGAEVDPARFRDPDVPLESFLPAVGGG